MSEATTKPETFTLTVDELLTVYISGQASGIGTALHEAGASAAEAEALAKLYTGRIKHQILVDPGLREQLLSFLRSAVAGEPASSGWIR